ncbi:LpqB family beta-propeller domain-containing protein [Plantactinospora endophytica]|uniref:GerMN domain-containing protein n=1 Tax=Plantactinospora endophytica TaxID=673535 RepID=A0ABQ4DUD4_9ACTN|nr:LpqB family beta-propeller domain-containing protein [Plantactinospora endophytica]GIG86076.1 hypothetical protein Pen02_10120 [Plantactinospora endophytica]
MNRRRLALGAVAVLLSGLVGCGIPDETDVRIDGRGPVANTAPEARTGGQPPGRTDSGSDQETFAMNYLTAAAGEPGDAYKRVNEFILEGSRLKPKAEDDGAVNVVRIDADKGGIVVTQRNDGTSVVTVFVQQVGVLQGNGSIDEPVEAKTSYSFVIGGAPTDPGLGGGLWVLEPPSVLLMADTALATYYQETTIYFWNFDKTTLLPDLRYLPRSVPVQAHATAVLNWLIDGPSHWLTPVAARLPEGTTPVGNVPVPERGGRLEVNLSVKAGALETDLDLQQLFTQIVWSLRLNQLLDNELELKIQNQPRMVEVADDYRQKHPLYQIDGAPVGYAVFDGRIHELAGSASPVSVPIPATENQNIVTAGMSRDGDAVAVALVRREGDSVRLRTGSGVKVAQTLVNSGGRYTTLGRPVWLKETGNGGPVGLVVADDRLMTFTAGGPNLNAVSFSGTAPSVSAVGAAMDGNRIAFVSKGQLYVAGVRLESDGLKVVSTRRLSTSLHELSAVDWFGENLLVVAGMDGTGHRAIHRVNVDSARESPQGVNLGAAPIEALAAYPVEGQPFQLMHEANQVAFMGDQAISPKQVAPGEVPPPSSSTSANAAFYLY